ncbi:MAG: hypothetical protein ACXWUG_25675 [Polyangiales bacterium]
MTIDPIVIVVSIVCAIAFGIWISSLFRSSASRGRNQVAQRGETEAEAILEALGYRVVERQARAGWSIVVDGEEQAVEVRADLIVSRKGRTFVAEVKTGSLAPDPTHPPTRRQLLEYSLVFGADEVLLVDVPARAVRSVSFPF